MIYDTDFFFLSFHRFLGPVLRGIAARWSLKAAEVSKYRSRHCLGAIPAQPVAGTLRFFRKLILFEIEDFLHLLADFLVVFFGMPEGYIFLIPKSGFVFDRLV